MSLVYLRLFSVNIFEKKVGFWRGYAIIEESRRYMEEKSPENRAQQAQQEKPKKRKKSKTNWPATIGTSLLLTAIVLIICFFLQGETKVTNNDVAVEASKSLACEVEGAQYPFFKYDNATKKTTKVNAIFNGDKLDTISLIQELYYNSSDEIVRSEAENHAALNLKTQGEGLGPDAFGANYAKLSDRLKFSMYAKAEQLKYETVKYFELDWVESGTYNLPTMEKIYTEKGFDCKTIN